MLEHPMPTKRGTPDAAVPARPVVVLVLHGGRADSMAPSRRWGLASLRMLPFIVAVRRALHGRDATVLPVRYRVRGWNGERRDAAVDARVAVAEAAASPSRPRIVLLGHSMGGRAALAAAIHPQVVGVVALAPWTPPGEPVDHLADKVVYVLHSPEDTVTDPAASHDFVVRARASGADAHWQPVPGSGHAMLGRAFTWHRQAASHVLDCLERHQQ